ncbi:MAG: DEAD/DEAH box helicase, partial [Victivallales bacterium]|nr:DEAD/DEAH box helicase [Victivallales bacterium]
MILAIRKKIKTLFQGLSSKKKQEESKSEKKLGVKRPLAKRKTPVAGDKKIVPPRRRNDPPVRTAGLERDTTNLERIRRRKSQTDKKRLREESEVIFHPLEIPPKPEKLTEIPPEEGKTRFTDLPIAEDVLFGIQSQKFRYCTPIQAQCLSSALVGRDITGKAQTGTGKTAAFLIAAFTRMLENPLPLEKRQPGSCRMLVLAPTRELAIQIHQDAEKLSMYCGFHNLAVFGGMGHKTQRAELARPVDVLVGTPGRILDYCSTGDLNLRQVEILVIDEADRMLDMGFIPDVKRIVGRLPKTGARQT